MWLPVHKTEDAAYVILKSDVNYFDITNITLSVWEFLCCGAQIANILNGEKYYG